MIPNPDTTQLLTAIAKEVGLLCPCCGRTNDVFIADYTIALRRMIDAMERYIGPDPRRAVGGRASAWLRPRDASGKLLCCKAKAAVSPGLSYSARIGALIGKNRSGVSESLRIARVAPIEIMEQFKGMKLTRVAFLKAILEENRRRGGKAS